MAGCASGGWLIAVLAAATPDPVLAPSPQLIEFLAEFADAEGRFLDPLDAAAALATPLAGPDTDEESDAVDAAAAEPKETNDAPPQRHHP